MLTGLTKTGQRDTCEPLTVSCDGFHMASNTAAISAMPMPPALVEIKKILGLLIGTVVDILASCIGVGLSVDAKVVCSDFVEFLL
jgi:hypothetical protein